MMITFKALLRLYFRQFVKDRKREFVLTSVMVVYCWVVELFIFLKGGVGTLDSPGAMLVVVGILDFITKLFTQQDNTVMDAFLKTRPLSEKTWRRYLRTTHLWEPLNLFFPLTLIPVWLALLPFGRAVLFIVCTYLLSVALGLLMMRLKRRGPYLSEKAVVRKNGRAAVRLTSRLASGSLGIQVKGLLRSKRLLGASLPAAFYFLLTFLRVARKGEANVAGAEVLMLFFIFTFAQASVQFGLSVEAKFFNGLWTKPFPLRRLLEDKYNFAGILTVISGIIGALAGLPFHFPVYSVLARVVFVAGFAPLPILIDPYDCVPFDPFNKTQFNTSSRTQGAFRVMTVLATSGTFISAGLLHLVNSQDLRNGIFFALGILGYLLHKRYFAWVERKFLADRYKYMDKYNEQ